MNALVKKEMKDAVRNRWVVGYAAVLAVLGFAAAWFGVRTTGGMAVQMLGRTTATITNLSLLVAPLVGLVLGAATIAGERDRGTLQRLLSLPITSTDLLLWKYLGLLIALSTATLCGFAPAALMIVLVARPASVVHFLIFPGITVLLIASMTAVGVLISATASTASKALGGAVMAWFSLVLLYDLLLIGSLAVASMSPAVLISLVVANPIDAARILAVLILEPDLYVLGPAGAALLSSLGRAGAAAVLAAVIAAWTILALLFAARRFRASIYARRPLAAKSIKTSEMNYSFAKAPEPGA